MPLGGLLSPYGITMHLRPLDGGGDHGGKPGAKDADKRGSLGVTLGGGGDGATLSVVHEGGAALAAGLSAGDVIIAVDGLKVGRSSFAKLVDERAPGERLHVHAFRRDELFETDVVLLPPELQAAYFAIDDSDAAAAARRRAWLTPSRP